MCEFPQLNTFCLWMGFRCKTSFASIVEDMFSFQCKIVIDPHLLPPFPRPYFLFHWTNPPSVWLTHYSVNLDARFIQRRLRHNYTDECTFSYLYSVIVQQSLLYTAGKTVARTCRRLRIGKQRQTTCLGNQRNFDVPKLIKILQFTVSPTFSVSFTSRSKFLGKVL